MRWTSSRANQWYKKHPWLVGCNYAPRTAINQLEMWQAETFMPGVIDEELAWAADLGMNTVRVFLHDLLWFKDSKAFLSRFELFLQIAERHGIGAMPVFFDSVWHPFPYLGKQRDPEPGVHNSGWVQSPGVAILKDEKQFNALEDYVASFVEHFRDDPRIHIWDVWNEPDNINALSYGPRDIPDKKAEIVTRFLPRVFDWVRSAKPTQPLTSGVWLGEWTSPNTLKPWEKVQIEQSDVISFHCYGNKADVELRVRQLQQYGRPLLCTEYMSRGSGSTFEDILPIFKKHRVGAYNWGFVAGKTQTNYPWDSWQQPYKTEPAAWFHEIFRSDGSPYNVKEVELIKSLTKGKTSSTKRGRKGKSNAR